MKISSLFRAFLPKDDRFFVYFDKNLDNLLLTAQTFRDLMSEGISREERAQKIAKVVELEHRGDEITHQIFSELGATFITPFDREDIHALASKIDDILDFICGASTRIVLYGVKKISPEQERLAALVYDQVSELHKAVRLLHNFHDVSAIRESLVRINSIENEADDLFERAIADLFDTCDDPIKLIKSKEMLVSIETATDKCEDAANVIESIVVKNA